MSTQDLQNRRSTLLQRYQPGAGSQNPLQQPPDSAPITRSTSQRSLQNSSLLQKYYPKTTSQDLRTGPPTQPETASTQPKRSSSQRSLDKSKLLQRYNKQNSLDSQDVPKPEPQQYSSQKSLESSKLLQRYNVVNNSQEFTGLAPRESTPVARFQRSGSLDHDKMTRSSLLSKYTPRFGKSLDRNKPPPISSYSNYSSQQSLDQQDSSQSISASQTIGDYGGDHFDQYDARNLRSRSSSVAKGLNRKSLQRDLPPPLRSSEIQKENVPLEPVTPETLPVVAASVPVMGNIASALPMPMLTAVTPAPMLEISAPTQEPLPETTQPSMSIQPVVSQPQPETPKRKEPVKPPRKDLATVAAVSIPIPNIKTTITVEPPTPIIPTKKDAPVVPKDPSPPLFSNRDRMEHYGGAPILSSSPPSQPPSKQQSKSPARTTSSSTNDTLLLPITDFSSRRSMTDLRQAQDESSSLTMEIDEFSDRNELNKFTKKRDSIKSTLASAFEQIAVLSVPQARSALEEDGETIESLPPNRKLKKRDHTYHPSFVPKQAKLEENERKKQEEKAKQDIQKKEQERKKEEEKLKKEEERLKKENEKLRKDEERRRKEDDKKIKAEEEKHRKEDEKKAKAEQEKLKKEAERLAKEEEKLIKEEEKRLREEEKRLREEEKRKRNEEIKKQKEEKKKAASQKSVPTDQIEPKQPEEDTIEFGNHLEQYSISPPPPKQSTSVGKLPLGSQGALNRHTLPAMSTPMYSSQQSLDRTGGAQSKMLQRYAKRSGSQDFTHSTDIEEARKFIKDVHTSHGSLDQQRATRSSLLQKYTPKPLSASTAGGPTATVAVSPSTPKSTSQVSLDKTRLEKSSLLQRYNKPREESADGRTGELPNSVEEPRKSAIVFAPKKISDKPTMFDYR